MRANDLRPLDDVFLRLERAVAESPADFTEIVWIERRRSRSGSSARLAQEPAQLVSTAIVRVRERRRFGLHRVDGRADGEIRAAIRLALAQARLHPPIAPWRPPEVVDAAEIPEAALFDPRLAGLDSRAAHELLAGLAESNERLSVDWCEGRVVVLNSAGLRRAQQVTSATVFAVSGQGSDAGTARASARTLEGLAPLRVLERARERRGKGAEAQPPGRNLPVVLSPEAAGALLATLADLASEAMAGGDGGLFSRSRGCAPPAAAFALHDDALDPTALPFPFDCTGRPKRPLPLIDQGVVQPVPLGSSCPVDQTRGFAAGGDVVRCSNLVLAAGPAAFEDLLAAAEGGIWIGALPRLACFGPGLASVGGRVRGARQIRDGGLGEPLPDHAWEMRIEDLLAGVLMVGRERVSRADGDGIFGGVTAPGIAIAAPESAPA